MKKVATPWYVLSKIILLVLGIPFFLIGIVLLYVLNGNLALLINGTIWMIIGAGLLIKGAYNQRKLKNLKREGLCYESSVVRIIPSHWVRIGSYVTARVECVCKTEVGDHLIKSGYHLLSPFDRIDNLYVKTYFDYNDSEKYVIEVYRGINY